MTPNRRTVLIGIGSGIAGIIGTSAFTNNAEAAALSVDNLDVSDATKDTSKTVNRLDLTINGHFQYETSVVPDSVVLRLEAKHNNSDWMQLDAMQITDNLSESYGKDFTLSGALSDLPNVASNDINPTDVGETKTLDFEYRVILQVRNDNNNIHEKTITDSNTVEINKTTVKVNSSVDATGEVSIVTSLLFSP